MTRLRDATALTTIADNQYSYNTASQISQIADLGGAHNYGYDLVDRLTSATYPATTAESYGYDGVGNRTTSHRSATYGYQPFNRLTGTATATYSYDNNGNLLSKTDTTGTTTYSWDFENRLKQVTLPNGNVVAYKYDALGRRISRTASILSPLPLTTTTRFIYDGADVIRDTDGFGITTADYLNGPGIDNKLRQTTAAAGTLYFIQDHLGSTRALTDGSGNVVEQQQYDSFGNSAGSVLTRYGYTGRERDSDTGLLYYRARFYDPQVGRFLSEDPIGLEADINLYSYVNNDPLNYSDPLGLFSPNHPYCQSLRKKIENIEREIQRRQGERHDDKLNLPWRAAGDKQKPSLSRWGHEMLINRLKEQLAALRGLYAARCSDPDTPSSPPLPVACRAPIRIPIGQSQGELDSKAEAARQRYIFWQKVTIGGYVVGSVLTGGALFGGGSAAAALVPAFAP